MPRKIVPLVTGSYYHIYNRGVDKRDIFLKKDDYLRFYESLIYFNKIKPVTNFQMARLQHKRYKESLVEVEAYCLLPNHFHLILKQTTEGGISEYMKRVMGGYTSYFNEDNDRTGALFQGTYKRVLIDTDHYFNYLFAYVNENHVVHNLPSPEEVYQSSTLHYTGKFTSSLMVTKSHKFATYNRDKSISLANDIWQKRQQHKLYLHEA